jgi:glycosyltransferase involved in cell wall biosynthesis/ubiquinone/menaquinone biosynthesis C-methylase UbiE
MAKASPSPRIGIFIVAFNAERTIGSVLARIQPQTWERITQVFVFDDHSEDETVRVALREQPEAWRAKIRIFHNQVNLGYGGNQKRGYQYALREGIDIIILLHGDGQYAPEALDRLIDPLAKGEADVVLGSRMMQPGGALRGGMPLYKFLGNRILTSFQNLCLGRRLSEYHSGYRAYRTSVLNRLPLLKNSNDFHFDNEIILQCFEAGVRILEVPIPTYYGSEICYVNGMKYAWDVFRTTLRYRAHKLGLVYAPCFDLGGGTKYRFKASRFSSHRRLIDLVGPAPAASASKALDLGCGSGFLAGRLRELGHTVTGVDVYDSPEARAACARFVVADLDRDLGVPAGEPFDCIVMADVLEHTRAPEQILLKVRNHLKEGGSIVASTGNVANFYIRLRLLLGSFEYTERGILDRTHCRLFTRGSFRRLLEESGFKVLARADCPIPFELVFPGSPRLAGLLTGLYMLGVWIWPSLFAFQTVLKAELSHAPTELLREEEIRKSEFVESRGSS